MARAKHPIHPPVVFVEWHDSRSLSSRWEDRTDLLDKTADLYREEVVSVGFLLESNKKYIVIALGLAPNDDVMHAIQIPRSEISLYRVLKRARGMKLVKSRG